MIASILKLNYDVTHMGGLYILIVSFDSPNDRGDEQIALPSKRKKKAFGEIKNRRGR